MPLRSLPFSLAFVAILSIGASASIAQAPPRAKPDLANAIEGTWSGNIISDVRGPSRKGVAVLVTRTGSNTVSVKVSQRIPPRTYRLKRYADTIQNVPDASNEILLYESAKDPQMLSLSIDDASWSGFRQ